MPARQDLTASQLSRGTLGKSENKMKKSWIKKGIVGIIMLAIFLAPFSGEVKINEKGGLAINLTKNKAEAMSLTEVFSGSDTTFKTGPTNSNSTIFSGKLILCEDCRGGDSNTTRNTAGDQQILIYRNIRTDSGKFLPQEGIYFIISDETTDIAKKSWLELGKIFSIYNYENPFSINTLNITTTLKEKTKYYIRIEILGNSAIPGAGLIGGETEGFGGWWKRYTSKPVEFTTTAYNKDDPTDPNSLPIDPASGGLPSGHSTDSFGCQILPSPNVAGCVAQLFYDLWIVTALIARLGGHFLDFFVYYSTNSSSYTNEFVSQAWGAVRDIANIFFIIALLYVAIKTILGLNVTDNKKIVGAVIIIGLIINFSLFTTKVVIDGSNILAKIFYNNITSKDATQKNADGTQKDATGGGGEKSISVGLVDKFNPQDIAMTVYKTEGVGYFIFITLLLMAITLYTAYIFFSVAVLFVARVVSLWISMIFSPLAFVSYAVPFEIPGFGHKEWWGNLLKNAFLAPIFVFFLYIIVLFAGFLGNTYPTGDSVWAKLLNVTVPFAILFMLLKMAKDLAIKYSGEMGAALMKGAQMVGGLALGAATGGAALAGRATLGRAGAAMANSGWAKKWEAAGWGGGMARSVFKAGAKGSFDVRGIKVAGKDLAGVTGMTMMGKPKEGGFEKARKDQVEKRQKRAKELEVGEDENLKQNVRHQEAALHEIKTGNIVNTAGVTVRRQDEIIRLNNGTTHAEATAAQTNQTAARAAQAADPTNPVLIAAREAATQAEIATRGLAGLERNVTAAERAVASAERAVKDAVDNLATANATGTAAQQATAQAALVNTRRDRDAQINGGELTNGQRVDQGNSLTGAREVLETRQATLRATEGPVKEAENMLKLAENAVTGENRTRRENYAGTIQGGWSQSVNFITSGGQHSFRGEREAANKILADIQEEKK